MARATTKSYELGVDVFGIGGKVTWEPDDSERRAAWELYVEMVTRIAVARLDPESGSFREALTSYYDVFKATREILRRYGPTVAGPHGRGNASLGYLALWLLNGTLRPFLAKWHPLLLDHENRRDPKVSAIEHERRWRLAHDLQREMESVARTCTDFARLFEAVVGIPSLIPP